MLTREEIFTIYSEWESNYLPALVSKLQVENDRQKQALFRVFDSLIWGVRDRNLSHRIERASYTLEAAAMPKVKQALSEVVGVAVSSLSGYLGEEHVPAALLAEAPRMSA